MGTAHLSGLSLTKVMGMYQTQPFQHAQTLCVDSLCRFWQKTADVKTQ
ncbi:hypothetical protein PM8797T_22623 [Gimesia maris DSM 8797]|nr:hypothetical protein PM8797T_22623 [Gimesia maris DSM 8797]